MLALVTSKLVSIKQDAILTEVYNISFKERINKLRSSLLLFRQSLDRTISSVEEKTFKEKELKSISTQLSLFDYTLNDIQSEISSNLTNKYTKNIDPVDSEILYNSTLSSFDKIEELISLLEKNKIDWKKEISMGLITKCLTTCEEMFKYSSKLGINKITVTDLESRKEETKKRLKEIIYD